MSRGSRPAQDTPPIDVDAAPDPAAATIPPASLRLPRRLPLLPDVATPPPPPGLEPPIEAAPELEPDVEYELPESEVHLDADYDHELKFANLPLLHLSFEDRQDIRMRRLIQLGEQQVAAGQRAAASQAEQLRLLQGWQQAVQQYATDNHADRALSRRQRETCLGWAELARQLVTHPKALQAMATIALAIGTAMGIYDYLSPLLLPWLP